VLLDERLDDLRDDERDERPEPLAPVLARTVEAGAASSFSAMGTTPALGT
jgi:hypothetical protein